MFVFWVARMVCLPASCPSRDERVWAVYVASVVASSFFFLPQLRLGFSFYASTFSERVLPRLYRCTTPEVQFSRCFSSPYIAPHLLSLSSSVLFTYVHLFRASECGECSAWVRREWGVFSWTMRNSGATFLSAASFVLHFEAPDLLSMFQWTRKSFMLSLSSLLGAIVYVGLEVGFCACWQGILGHRCNASRESSFV
jgi:hypothetical protein